MKTISKADSFSTLSATICFVLFCAVEFASADDAAVREASEYQLKAAFLLNFGKFTEWPSGTLEAAPAMQLCVLGKDPFGGDLDKIVENQSIHGRPIQVVRISGAQKLKDCRILYVSAPEEPKFRQLLPSAQRTKTLTVSDSPQFIENGGMIQLFVEQQHVAFSVNLKMAEGAGLKISSKLLQIAKSVKAGS